MSVESPQAGPLPPPAAPERVAADLAAYRHTLGIIERDSCLDVALWFHSGQRHRSAGRIEDAVVCFKKVIELAPDDPWAYEELAEIYAGRSDVRPAIVVLTTLADRLAARRRWEGTVQALERALEVAPGDGDVLERLQEAYTKAGRARDAARLQARRVTLSGQPAAPSRDQASASAAAQRRPDGGAPAVQPAPKAGSSPPGAAPPPPQPASPPESAGGRSAAEVLGEILLGHGWVSQAQIDQAMEIQRQSGGRLGQILVKMGVLGERQLARALAQQWRLPYVDLAGSPPDPEIVRLVPTYVAQRHGVVAIGRKKDRLTLAMSDPSNIVAIDDVRLLTGLEVEIAIASEADIARVQVQHLGVSLDVDEFMKQAALPEPEITEDPARGEEVTIERLRTMVDEAPIVRVVNQVLTQAVNAGASDIHIEPLRQEVKVRFRIDGLLHDVMATPRAVQAALISRVKILAAMDIAERRLPQDGHVHLRIEGRAYDLRVSTLPTVLGEKLVIRILDQSSTRVAMEQLGFSSDQMGTWEKLITRPYGMILVTGPTGSGKTTTLYTSLGRINTPERNIVSVEDPVEYQIPRVNQVQVNPKSGLMFARALRSILRQDPDVVLIGEIRDRETAEIAVQASMTGHLVLSTIHTNDAPGAIVRLRDMGVESFLITGSMLGVLAQRLVRVIDPRCKEAYTPPAEALRRLGLESRAGVRLYRGRGCENCNGTGYRGRTGVFELMVMNDGLRELVVTGASTDRLREASQRHGMRTLRQDGIQKLLEGVTTVEELLRVVFVNDAESA